MAHSDGLVRSGEVNQLTKLLFILEFKILKSQVIDLIFGTVWKWNNFSHIIGFLISTKGIF